VVPFASTWPPRAWPDSTLADGGEELPGQVAAGLRLGEFGLGLLVGVEDGRGDARLGLALRDRGAYGGGRGRAGAGLLSGGRSV